MSVVIALTWTLRNRLSEPRKLLHVLTGGIVFFWWAFDTRVAMAGLAAFPFVIVLLLATPKSPINWLKRGPLGLTSQEGHHYGLVMYAISWTLIAYFMFDSILAASIAIAAMSFGDGMGEVVGRRYGSRQYLRGRTVEGTIAVFFAATVSVLVLIWFYAEFLGEPVAVPKDTLMFALAVGGFVSVLEAIAPGKIDNLVVPLVTGGYLMILGA